MSKVFESGHDGGGGRVISQIGEASKPTVVLTLTVGDTTLYRPVPTFGKGKGVWFTEILEALAEARVSWESEARSYTRKSRGLLTANSMLAEIDRLAFRYRPTPR